MTNAIFSSVVLSYIYVQIPRLLKVGGALLQYLLCFLIN